MCQSCEIQTNRKHGFHAHAARKDPTHTLTLRRAFEADFNRRFRELKKLIRETIVKDDAFGLKVNATSAGAGAFAFARSGDKVQLFMDWLRDAQDELLFEVRRGTRVGTAGNMLWSDIYIESAYQRGLAQSINRMRGAGADISDRWLDSAFYRPIHADQVGLIFTRTYNDLVGITEAMDQQISRVLAQGMAQGLDGITLAKQLEDRVDKIGRTRARTLARTEIVSAHAEASLNGYEEAQVAGVELEAEFSTSGDEAVCQICKALADNGPYTIQQARGLIPAHPNCRCAWIPIVVEPGLIRL